MDGEVKPVGDPTKARIWGLYGTSSSRLQSPSNVVTCPLGNVLNYILQNRTLPPLHSNLQQEHDDVVAAATSAELPATGESYGATRA